jgi:hypothetical protein
MEHFKVVHPAAASTSNTSVDNVGNHPNAWFHASVAYHKANSKEKKPSAMTPGAKGAASLTEPAATAVSP